MKAVSPNTWTHEEEPRDTDGPYVEWLATEAELTNAMREDFDTAHRAGRQPDCPSCHQPVETLGYESVFARRLVGYDFVELGLLWTLEPCGHRFKT